MELPNYHSAKTRNTLSLFEDPTGPGGSKSTALVGKKSKSKINQSMIEEKGSLELPTLGLNKYKNVSFDLNPINPFRVVRNDEFLLVNREFEREHMDYAKEH